jgi:putative phosphoribosyl transferase
MFRDRVSAGRMLAEELSKLHINDAVVLALPRGGVVLGDEVAREFDAPLGLVLVRKISNPFFPEYALGAVVDHEEPVYGSNERSAADKYWLSKAETNAYKLNAYRRELYYGSDYAAPDIEHKTAIIVDDGIATGLTMKASVLSVRQKNPKRIIVAAPVASIESIDQLRGLADEVVVLYDPSRFKGSVGAHYLEFDQVDDDEVRGILRQRTPELPHTASWR